MFTVRSIGIAHTPYHDRNEAPFQGSFSPVESEVEVFEQYEAGLKDVERATHLIILYWAHLASRDTLQTATPWGPEVHGVFATRSPARPNPISLCVVELVRRQGNRLTVRGLDAVDGSQILDIKPYGARMDSIPSAKIDWLDESERPTAGGPPSNEPGSAPRRGRP